MSVVVRFELSANSLRTCFSFGCTWNCEVVALMTAISISCSTGKGPSTHTRPDGAKLAHLLYVSMFDTVLIDLAEAITAFPRDVAAREHMQNLTKTCTWSRRQQATKI